MIPVMMRFWMPHGAGGGPPPVGENWDCDDQSLVCDFLTDGAIDGESPEVVPGTTFYESASAVASDGWASPANFNVIMDSDPAVTYSQVFQVYVASGETVTLQFRTTSATDNSGTFLTFVLALGAGDACTLLWEIYDAGSLTDSTSDTFSIGASANTFAVYAVFSETDINIYIPPDAGSPTATLSDLFWHIGTGIQSS